MANSNNFKSIGATIKELREERGMTQAELAKKLNVKRETVNQWENNVRDLKTQYTISLAKEFDVSADYILGITPGVKTTDTTVKGICEYTGLSENAVKMLKNRGFILDDYSEETRADIISFLNGLIESGFAELFSLYINDYKRAYEKAINIGVEGKKVFNKAKLLYDQDIKEKNDSEVIPLKEQMRFCVNQGLFKEINTQDLALYRLQKSIEDFVKHFVEENINGKHTRETE